MWVWEIWRLRTDSAKRKANVTVEVAIPMPVAQIEVNQTMPLVTALTVKINQHRFQELLHLYVNSACEIAFN